MTMEPSTARRRPPITVVLALSVLAVITLYAVWDVLSDRESLASAPMPGFGTWFWWLFAIFGVLLPVGLGFAILARRHWARVALLVLFAIEWLVIVVASAVAEIAEVLFDVGFLVWLVAELVMLVLLFLAPSSRWFRVRSAGAS